MFGAGEEPELVIRPREITRLINAVGNPSSSRAYIYGEGGVGKTQLLEEAVRSMRGYARYFAIPTLPRGQFVDLLAELRTLSHDVSLLILDDIDHAQIANPAETRAAFADMPELAVFVTSSDVEMHWSWYEALGEPEKYVYVQELEFRQAREMLAAMGVMGPSVNTALGEYGGNPGRLLAWARGGEPGLLDARVSTLATVLAPDGSPLDSSQPGFQRIELEVRDASERLMRALAERPELMYELSSRKFEEAVADLWTRSGYTVELTRASKDGGVDFYAFQKTPFGSFLTVVDTKRYRPDRPVKVDLVRTLYGTTVAAEASAGVIATTSYFTAGAKSFQQERKHRVGLQDFISLKEMLERSVRESRPEKPDEYESE